MSSLFINIYIIWLYSIHFYVILRRVWAANTGKMFVLGWKMTVQRLTAGISFLSFALLLVSWSLQSAGRMSSSKLRDRSFCTHKSWPYIIILGGEVRKKIASKDNWSIKTLPRSSKISVIINFMKYIITCYPVETWTALSHHR